MSKFYICFFVFILFNFSKVFSQKKSEQTYSLNNNFNLVYPKSKPFSFITKLPKDAIGICNTTFSKKSIKPLLVIAGSTGVLLLVDDAVSKGVKQLATNLHISPTENNVNLLTAKLAGKETTLFKVPGNVNTGFYQLGQGFPGLMLAAGLYTYGKAKNDFRSISVSSQLTESFILMGIGTQIIKHIAGRQTPGEATVKGGKWQPFPSFKNYKNNTPVYDAFPSGHLATLMSSVTVLACNYPNSKFIKPVGYSLVGLVGFCMINNDVHWISDYPLAIGLGYLCGSQVAKTSRKLLQKTAFKNSSFMPSFTYLNNRIQPSIIFNF